MSTVFAPRDIIFYYVENILSIHIYYMHNNTVNSIFILYMSLQHENIHSV